MGYRVVPKAFIATYPVYVLYGPGRYNFGDRVHDWWIRANTTDDDPAVPAGFSTIITYDGISGAYARLKHKTGA